MREPAVLTAWETRRIGARARRGARPQLPPARRDLTIIEQTDRAVNF